MNVHVSNGEAWVKAWSGRWSLHLDSYAGELYTKTGDILGQPPFLRAIYVYEDGISSCWLPAIEKDVLGSRLVSKVRSDEAFIEEMVTTLIQQTDRVNEFVATHSAENMKLVDYDAFWQAVLAYYIPHMRVKYIADYLTDGESKKYLERLQEVRLYAEPIFRTSEDYFESMCDSYAKVSGYSKESLLATTKDELRTYLSGGVLPEEEKLETRYVKSVLVAVQGELSVLVGSEVSSVEQLLASQVLGNEIKGDCAYSGIVKGKVRIIMKPEDVVTFDMGDILVTGMTRPEFLPLIQKASAIVTDSGGVLSHAAITARELKKPCVIGTKNGTQFLHEGDLVEVDAEKGIVKIIERAG